MSYRSSLEYLSQLHSKGINLDLGPISRLLQRLGDPQRSCPSILIGGSNGKGSVAATISSVLGEAGFKVGLYTSPHLVDFRERIRVKGAIMSPADLYELVEHVRYHVLEEVTYFEFATAMAFMHFARCHVDVAVLEVGMGGRLDATNVVVPEVSVITNIVREHQQYLGASLPLIAREKGGIIKEGGVCITASKQRAVLQVIEEICTCRHAHLYRAGKDIRTRRRQRGVISYYGIFHRYNDISMSLVGRHQIENVALALGAIEILISNGWSIGDEAVRNGVKKVQWNGRLELLCHSPRLVVDGAHNGAAASALKRSLCEDFTYERLILVFGVMEDKDYTGMLKILAPLADSIILTRPEGPRAADPHALEPIAATFCTHVLINNATRRALTTAFALAGKGDLVCVAGSLYLVGEVKKMLRNLSL